MKRSCFSAKLCDPKWPEPLEHEDLKAKRLSRRAGPYLTLWPVDR